MNWRARKTLSHEMIRWSVMSLTSCDHWPLQLLKHSILYTTSLRFGAAQLLYCYHCKLPIILKYCSLLLGTYNAQKNASIIYLGLLCNALHKYSHTMSCIWNSKGKKLHIVKFCTTYIWFSSAITLLFTCIIINFESNLHCIVVLKYCNCVHNIMHIIWGDSSD